MDPHHDKEQRSRLDRLKVFTGRRRFIGSLLLALATSTSQSQVLSSEFFPEMGAPALVERLASGDIIMVTEQNLIRIAPDGTVLSITPIDTCLSGWRADMVIQGDTALIVKCSEELYNIISLSSDSIGSITSPLDNYSGPELVIIPLSDGGIGPMLNGDLLMVNSTTVWCRSIPGDTLWSSSIYNSPFNKLCYLQDAIQLPNLDIIVTGYTVVDTAYIYGLDWAYIPWIGRLDPATGALIDSVSVPVNQAVSSFSATGTQCQQLIPTSDGGFACVFINNGLVVVVRGSALFEVLWTFEGVVGGSSLVSPSASYMAETSVGDLWVTAVAYYD